MKFRRVVSQGMKNLKQKKKKLEDEQRRRMQEFMKKNQEERMKAMKVCNDTMRMFFRR